MTTAQSVATMIEQKSEMFPIALLVKLDDPSKFLRVLHAVEEIAETLEISPAVVVKAIDEFWNRSLPR